MASKRFANDIRIKNKRARFEYQLFDQYIAGIQLEGTEIKSIREGKANINDSFVSERNGEMFVRNMYIAEYDQGTHNNHEPRRDRRLLLNKREIKKITKHLILKGQSAIPTLLFINEKGLAKLEFYTAQGKKLHDKREDIKKRDVERNLSRNNDY
ncbi:MAG: SsrA-binding protein [Crocinitomicaceae bacterium]|nr:SsrA-binding protein [Crocinitomicaceae bacterium]